MYFLRKRNGELRTVDFSQINRIAELNQTLVDLKATTPLDQIVRQPILSCMKRCLRHSAKEQDFTQAVDIISLLRSSTGFLFKSELRELLNAILSRGSLVTAADFEAIQKITRSCGFSELIDIPFLSALIIRLNGDQRHAFALEVFGYLHRYLTNNGPIDQQMSSTILGAVRTAIDSLTKIPRSEIDPKVLQHALIRLTLFGEPFSSLITIVQKTLVLIPAPFVFPIMERLSKSGFNPSQRLVLWYIAYFSVDDPQVVAQISSHLVAIVPAPTIPPSLQDLRQSLSGKISSERTFNLLSSDKFRNLTDSDSKQLVVMVASESGPSHLVRLLRTMAAQGIRFPENFLFEYMRAYIRTYCTSLEASKNFLDKCRLKRVQPLYSNLLLGWSSKRDLEVCARVFEFLPASSKSKISPEFVRYIAKKTGTDVFLNARLYNVPGAPNTRVVAEFLESLIKTVPPEDSISNDLNHSYLAFAKYSTFKSSKDVLDYISSIGKKHVSLPRTIENCFLLLVGNGASIEDVNQLHSYYADGGVEVPSLDTALFALYAINGDPTRAQEHYKTMRQKLLRLTRLWEYLSGRWLSTIIRHLLLQGETAKALRLIQSMNDHGLPLLLHSVLVCLDTASNKPEEALSLISLVFENVRASAFKTSETLGKSLQSCPTETIVDIYSAENHMQYKTTLQNLYNSQTCGDLLEICVSSGETDLGKQIYSKMVDDGVQIDEKTLSPVVKLYCAEADYDSALTLALSVDSEIAPDLIASILQVLCIRADWATFEQVLAAVKSRGIHFNVKSRVSVVLYLFEHGHHDRISTLLREIVPREPNEYMRICGPLFQRIVLSDHLDIAEDIVSQIEQSMPETVKSSSAFLEWMSQYIEKYELEEKLKEYLDKYPDSANLRACEVVLRLRDKNEDATVAIDRLRENDMSMYGYLVAIRAFGDRGDISRAEALFNEANERFFVNKSSQSRMQLKMYMSLIIAHGKSSDLEKALGLFYAVTSRYGSAGKAGRHALLQAYFEAGRYEEGIDFVKRTLPTEKERHHLGSIGYFWLMQLCKEGGNIYMSLCFRYLFFRSI